MQYREKNRAAFIADLKQEFGDFYLVPEGGANALAVKGCQEILSDDDHKIFSHVCIPCGTGASLAGLIASSDARTELIGVPVLKSGEFLEQAVDNFLEPDQKYGKNWRLICDYHFGGYAKIDQDLVQFIDEFECRHNIPLEPIYSGKMMYGIFDLVDKRYFEPGSQVLAIHTGGMQGLSGMSNVMQKLRASR